MTKPFVLPLLQLNLILERRRKGWNKLLWRFIPGAERFAPLISVPWSELCYVISVWGDLIPGTFGLVESQIPGPVTGKGEHCILLPALDMSKESSKFDIPGPITPSRQPSSAFNAIEKPLTFFLPRQNPSPALSVTYTLAEVSQQSLYALHCGQLSLPAHAVSVCHIFTSYWRPFHHSLMRLCTDPLVVEQDEWKPWKEHGKCILSQVQFKRHGQNLIPKCWMSGIYCQVLITEREEEPWGPAAFKIRLKWEFFGKLA